MLKRFISMLLAAVMLLSLCACGSANDTPLYYNVNGVAYSAELGAPVLGKTVGELATTANFSEAAQQITNIGDALYYLFATGSFDQPSDMCRLVADLIYADYDEVGFIYLEKPGNGYCLLYVRCGENYYPLDLFLPENTQGLKLLSDTALSSLCDTLLTMSCYNTMTSCWSEVLLHSEEPINLQTDDKQREEQVSVQMDDRRQKEYTKLMARVYTDEELQALVDDNLTLQGACEKISTVSDAIRYLYLRGYHFAPEDAGIESETRYALNSGGCVGGSGLFNALLEDDYDAQGYVYIFYARGEHVFDYFVIDGVYFFCDFVSVFHSEGANPNKSPVVHVATDPKTIFVAWFDIEPNDLNDSSSDMYLVAMYTTAYCGDPTMPTTRLVDTPEGNFARIPLSSAEKESQTILFIRDGYTFEFSE